MQSPYSTNTLQTFDNINTADTLFEAISYYLTAAPSSYGKVVCQAIATNFLKEELNRVHILSNTIKLYKKIPTTRMRLERLPIVINALIEQGADPSLGIRVQGSLLYEPGHEPAIDTAIDVIHSNFGTNNLCYMLPITINALIRKYSEIDSIGYGLVLEKCYSNLISSQVVSTQLSTLLPVIKSGGLYFESMPDKGSKQVVIAEMIEDMKQVGYEEGSPHIFYKAEDAEDSTGFRFTMAQASSLWGDTNRRKLLYTNKVQVSALKGVEFDHTNGQKLQLALHYIRLSDLLKHVSKSYTKDNTILCSPMLQFIKSEKDSILKEAEAIKNGIATKALTIPAGFSTSILLHIPPELTIIICSILPYQALPKLMRTCRYAYNLVVGESKTLIINSDEAHYYFLAKSVWVQLKEVVTEALQF